VTEVSKVATAARSLAAIVCLALGLATPNIGAAATLRLAIPNPPIGRGNPYQAPGPANTLVAPAIFDALTVIDGKGQLTPGLALSWSSDAAAKVWTFKLRPHVTFSNGTAFDADAVVAALTYLTKNPLPGDLVAIEFTDVQEFQALDPLTVQIKTRHPMPLLPHMASVLFIVEPNTWRALGPQGFAAAPVGTGPFRVEKWGPEGIRLDAVPTSWRAPKMDKLEILFQQDATSRLQGLLAGRIDIALALAADDEAALKTVGAKLLPVPIPSVTAIMFLAAKPGSPFADERVRQAANYAVDKERLVRAFFSGAFAPSGQAAAKYVLGHDPSILPYPYDPARARALLSAAGYADGLAFTFEAVVGSSGSDGAMYQQIAQDLEDVKIHTTIRSSPGIRFGQLFRTGEWTSDAFAFIYGAEPAFDGIRALKYYSCDWKPQMYCDPKAEPLFKLAEAAPTIAARAEIGRQIMARYHDQAAGLFLFDSPRFHGVSGRLRDFGMQNTRIEFESIHVDP